jgi:hypothetical protein
MKQILLIILLLISANVFAQEKKMNKDTTLYLWISGGLNLRNLADPFSKYSVETRYKSNMVTVSYFRDADFNLFSCSDYGSYYSLLYGKALLTKVMNISLSIGSSFSEITKCKVISQTSSGWFSSNTKYGYDSYLVPGIDIRFQHLVAYKVIGIGFSIEGNINSKRSVTILGLSIYFGKIN